MEQDEDRRRFVRELLECLRTMPPAGNEAWPAEINEFARRVKTRLTDLSEVLDVRSIKFYDHSVVYVKKLEKELKNTMSTRRKSEAGGLVGTAIRLGGTLCYVHPLGKAAFWIGLAVSAGCDYHAQLKGKEIRALSMAINERLNRSKDAFRPVAGAIRRLDEAIQERTGFSIYDEEFQNFLRDSEVQPDNAVVPCVVDHTERRNNLIELVRNRELLKLLQEIVRAICAEDVLFFTVVSQGLFALSFCSTCVNDSATFQVGELCARGFAMYYQYKNDEITLQHFGNEIGRMEKQLAALKEVSPYL